MLHKCMMTEDCFNLLGFGCTLLQLQIQLNMQGSPKDLAPLTGDQANCASRSLDLSAEAITPGLCRMCYELQCSSAGCTQLPDRSSRQHLKAI